MDNLQSACVNFQEKLHEISKRKRGDRVYEEVRANAERILGQFREDPHNPALIEECGRVVRSLEDLNIKELSSTKYQRSRSNIVYISALSKRTHYAAYMAGVWSEDTSISKPFKAWMYNSAADGAISLYEAAYPFINSTQNNSKEKSEEELKDESNRKLLSIFAVGAIEDAGRFLDLADRHFPGAAITRYNKARIDIYHDERDRVRQGVDNLKSIPCPSDDSEVPELIWHVDNYECFLRDNLMRERIQNETPENFVRIDQVLQKNRDEAQMRIDAEGPNLWDSYNSRSRALLVGAATGILMTLYAVLGDFPLSDLIGIATAHADVVSAATVIDSVSSSSDILSGLDFTRTIGFGGGGLA